MSVMLVVCLFCIAVLAAFCLWSNESWYRTCQSMNAEWLEKIMELAGSVREALDQMQKEIDELETKIEDDGR